MVSTPSSSAPTPRSSAGTPIDRVIVTHRHPDRWFGCEYFRDVPVYALAEVAGGRGCEEYRSGPAWTGSSRSPVGRRPPMRPQTRGRAGAAGEAAPSRDVSRRGASPGSRRPGRRRG
jgi:glyoxylase-like metal-dependent hydrolase (beta-lactamase superfamily II)